MTQRITLSVLLWVPMLCMKETNPVSFKFTRAKKPCITKKRLLISRLEMQLGWWAEPPDKYVSLKVQYSAPLRHRHTRPCQPNLVHAAIRQCGQQGGRVTLQGPSRSCPPPLYRRSLPAPGAQGGAMRQPPDDDDGCRAEVSREPSSSAFTIPATRSATNTSTRRETWSRMAVMMAARALLFFLSGYRENNLPSVYRITSTAVYTSTRTVILTRTLIVINTRTVSTNLFGV